MVTTLSFAMVYSSSTQATFGVFTSEEQQYHRALTSAQSLFDDEAADDDARASDDEHDAIEELLAGEGGDQNGDLPGFIDDTAVVVDRSLYRRVDMRANEDGVLPTAAELGLESETDETDDDLADDHDDLADDHDANNTILPRTVTDENAIDRPEKPDGMRACDWRFEQEFAAEAFDGSTLYPQSGNDRNGFVTGTNLGQYDREFNLLFHVVDSTSCSSPLYHVSITPLDHSITFFRHLPWSSSPSRTILGSLRFHWDVQQNAWIAASEFRNASFADRPPGRAPQHHYWNPDIGGYRRKKQSTDRALAEARRSDEQTAHDRTPRTFGNHTNHDEQGVSITVSARGGDAPHTWGDLLMEFFREYGTKAAMGRERGGRARRLHYQVRCGCTRGTRTCARDNLLHSFHSFPFFPSISSDICIL